MAKGGTPKAYRHERIVLVFPQNLPCKQGGLLDLDLTQKLAHPHTYYLKNFQILT